ncbi:MAG: hypothetical protein M3Z24_15865, partial [Chloroflexota bacterium]|nr:hypothetical protein [Chloroflexota bacterium]
VEMGPSNFITTKLSLKKGASFKLTDSAASPHKVFNGTWDASGTAHPAKESGAPTVNANFSGVGDSAVIGPFTTAGKFELYCSIHPGMNLTVTVS